MSDAQQELDDEILSACHDRELPPTEADAVRRRLAREPQLADRLRAMQCADDAAAGAFRALDREPVPRRTLDLLEAAEAEHRQRRLESGSVVPMRPRVTDRRLRLCRWPAALAAGVALAVGFSFGAALVPHGNGFSPGAFFNRHDCEKNHDVQRSGEPRLPQN